MPKISIIMPCLNAAKFIAEAIDSILAQTFDDFQLIIVDSGSVDNTLSIIKSYIEKDNRVSILSCDKKSMGAQYNLGLNNACGEYIGFVESDDYIDSRTYETLYGTFLRYDVDYVKANFDLFVDLPDQRLFFAYGLIAENQPDYYGKILGPEELSELARRDVYIWNGLYKREFIERNHIRFNETPGASFQDAGFASQVLILAERAVYLNVSLYRYRKGNPGASTSSVRTHEFTMDEFTYTLERLKENPEKQYLFLPAFLRRYFGTFHNCLHQYLYYNGRTEELDKKVKPFREQFEKCYHSLTFPQLSRSDLWPPQDLALFLENFAEYCDSSLTRYKSSIHVNIQAVGYLQKQQEIVICGIGENAASVYCYLARQGLKHVSAFCSSIGLDSYYGKAVLAAEEAVRRYPTATYVVTQSAGSQNSLKHQLQFLGVNSEQIVYYGSDLFHHNWHELPIKRKEDNNV